VLVGSGAAFPLVNAACRRVHSRLEQEEVDMAEGDTALAGKVALVTGGAKGIGFAVACDLAQRGAILIVADLEGAAAAAERIQKLGHRALGLKADVTSEQDVAHLAEVASAKFGGLDILVNNAAVFSTLRRRPFEEIDPAEWRRVMEVNTLGPFLCCRAVVPLLKARGGGRIINISSGVAFKGNPGMAHYVASKGAVVSLTRALATELGPFKILVNSVAPGLTLSDGVLENPELLAGAREFSVRTRALARDMTPADLVGAVAFLAGPDSAFVTGQTIVVDGGAYYH
jgi:NAD(P)-dependent dehydrogenase (short-subunit alcohol dehydrogenase family)